MLEQPGRFIVEKGKNMVFKLHKVFYGLKKAPRLWYERHHAYLIQMGFTRTSDNSNVYLKAENDDRVLVAEISLMIYIWWKWSNE